MAKAFGMSEPRGALVAEVHPGSPAEKAGLQREDIIIEYNDQPIKEMNELPRLVAATPPGTKTTVKVLREGKEKTLPIAVTELKEESLAAESEEIEDESSIGLVVEDVDPRLARRFGLKEDKGVVVVNTVSGSAAEEAGIRRGDIILEVNGKEIADVKAFQKIMAEQPKKAFVRFLIRREGRTLFLAVQIPEK
jgi:serine protease Do